MPSKAVPSTVLDALEQALHDRRSVQGTGLVHHSDRGVQHVSIRYTERLAEAGIELSVGSVGDSHGNALAGWTHCVQPSSVCSRPRLSVAAVRGVIWRASSSPLSNGWTGSTTAASSSRSGTSRQPRRRLATMPHRKPYPWRPGPHQTASGKPGAVQSKHVDGDITSRTDVAGILPDEVAIARLGGAILDRAVR